MSKLSYGITFNGLHTARDLGLIMTSKTIGFPDRTPILLRPPYSNRPIDQSGLYGHTVFGDRTFKCEFLIKDFESMTKQGLTAKLTRVVNWLESTTGRQPLIDDAERSYYYLGEPITAPDWAEMRAYGRLTVEWTCNPYRVAANPEGNQRWNDLNADMDVAQDVKFTVNGPDTVLLVNASNEILQPTITTTGDVTITVDGQPVELEEGTTAPLNQAYPLTLQPGENYVQVSGSGSLSFEWYKELI